MEEKKNLFAEALFDSQSTAFGHTENGATMYLTTGSKLVDQFGKAGNFRGRDINDVFADQSKIWDENADAALRFPFYLRTITRKVKINPSVETEKVQNGQGSRDEAFKRLLWIAKNHPKTFYENIWALPIIGSWKDIWTIMYYDKLNKVNAINNEAMFELMAHGLLCDTHVDLIKKYMPRIKSKSKCTTDWTKITNSLAKGFANYMGITYKQYNKLKTSGKAHDFQKYICAGEYNKLVWKHIPGRALNLLVTGKFLGNHNLKDSYTEWIISQPVAKFTGYVFELAKKLRAYKKGYYSESYNTVPIEVRHTLDAQFQGLVETARKNGNITENVLCALDTSGSMSHSVEGLNGVSCSDIANSLAIFFSELNTGYFHNKIMMFDNTSYPYTLKGNFCEKVMNLPGVPCGGTNFQSVVDEVIKIRVQHPEIPLSDYCTTWIVVSDMQFNHSPFWSRMEPTNFEETVRKLKEYFPADFVDNMKFIWWDCASRRKDDFEASAIEPGITFFSGFDGSIINMLLGEDSVVVDEKTGEKRNLTAEEMVVKALSQEILNYIKRVD